MNNPIIEEKSRIQKLLSAQASTVSEYAKMASEQTKDFEKRFGVKLNRPERVTAKTSAKGS